MSVGSCARIATSVALVLLWCVADAAPKHKRTPSTSSNPAIVEAERKWTLAERERDPMRARAAWLDAADAFLSIVEAAKGTHAEKTQAAHAGMLAIKNMLAVYVPVTVEPKEDSAWKQIARPLPAEEQRLLRLLGTFLEFEWGTDDAVSMKYVRANLYRRFDHFDNALPMLHEIVDKHRDHEVAEYSVNLLLDSYNRLQRYDELVAFAERIRADRAWLANKPDLADTLRKIRIQSLRMRGHGKFPERAGTRALPERDH
jgi:hypothetical protein